MRRAWGASTMLWISAGTGQLCDGTPRREFLRVGGAALLGMHVALPDLLRPHALPEFSPRAKAMILFVLEGGPAHQDLWDMKPDAPEQIRGEFRPIATTVPGLSFCEHLPLLAQQAHHLTLVR